MRRLRLAAAVVVVAALVLFFRGNLVLLGAAAVLKLTPSAHVHGPFGYYKGPNHSLDGTAGHGAYRVTYEDGTSAERYGGKTFAREGSCWADYPLPREQYADLDAVSALVLENALGPVTVRLDGYGLRVTGDSAEVTITRDGIEVSSVRPPDGFALEYTPSAAGVAQPSPRC